MLIIYFIIDFPFKVHLEEKHFGLEYRVITVMFGMYDMNAVGYWAFEKLKIK